MVMELWRNANVRAAYSHSEIAMRIGWILMATLVCGCAQQPPTAEQAAAQTQIDQKTKELIAAECKLYKGTGVTPKECAGQPPG
jgi:hypothetical protein